MAMSKEDVRMLVGSVGAVAVLFGFVMWPLMGEQQRSRVRAWFKSSPPVSAPSAKEAFEMKLRCSELKTKWENKFETDPGSTFDRPGFTTLSNVCYSPTYNTCLAETVSYFNCDKDHHCGTE